MPDHALRKLIDWYLDEEGYPIPERDGVVRYFYKIDGENVWASSKEELADKTGIHDKSKWDAKFLSFSFVSATIDDNPIMDEVNPTYRAWLEGLNPVDKARLLRGNWEARPQGANYWQREWMKPISLKDVPDNLVSVRAWDLASTERSQANKWPDPSACIKMSKDRQGYFYMQGDYHKDVYDDVLEVYGQFCKRSGDRDNHIIKQAVHDGEDCTIVLPVDPGSAGKGLYEQQTANFSTEGFKVRPDPAPNNKSKLTRFQTFATNCENGLVCIVEDTFDKKTLEFIYKQLEAFNGERSTSHRKDEFPDVCSSATHALAKVKVVKPFSLPDMSSQHTMLYRHKHGK